MIVTKCTTNVLTLPDGQGELELAYEPHDEDNILFERVGDQMVIAYLVHDACTGFNPLKDSDCQGDLYTKSPHWARDSTITDNDSELRSALGLDSYGTVDQYREVTIEGVTKDLGKHAAEQLYLALTEEQLTDQLLQLNRWNIINLSEGDTLDKLESGEPSRQLLTHLRTKYEKQIRDDLEDPNGYHSDLLTERIDSLYAKHWQEIAGPLVVPVSSNRCDYETTYTVTTWDGDTSDLPDGVWVADKGAEQNIGNGSRLNITIDYEKPIGQYRGPKSYWVRDSDRQVASFDSYEAASAHVAATYAERPFDIATAARHYAEGVLEEYSKWCSGEVYGCVVHTYDLKSGDDDEPQWIQGEVDIGEECWGFIGEEYAVEALASEFFEPTVKRLQRLQKPQFVTADDSEGGLTD